MEAAYFVVRCCRSSFGSPVCIAVIRCLIVADRLDAEDCVADGACVVAETDNDNVCGSGCSDVEKLDKADTLPTEF